MRSEDRNDVTSDSLARLSSSELRTSLPCSLHLHFSVNFACYKTLLGHSLTPGYVHRHATDSLPALYTMTSSAGQPVAEEPEPNRPVDHSEAEEPGLNLSAVYDASPVLRELTLDQGDPSIRHPTWQYLNDNFNKVQL